MEVGRDSHGVWDGHAHTAISKMGHQQGPATQQRALHSMLCGGLDAGEFGESGYTCMCG